MSRIDKRVRLQVLERDGYKCRYCGVELSAALGPEQEDGTCKVLGVWPELDHVIPRAKGGSSKADNLVASCGPCNRSKWFSDPNEWGGRK